VAATVATVWMLNSWYGASPGQSSPATTFSNGSPQSKTMSAGAQT
jgi:hypothetical protein